MAKKSRPSFTKRQKEMARQQKQKDKTARRTESRQLEPSSPMVAIEGEDPELAGIRPGPQPMPAWLEVPQRKA